MMDTAPHTKYTFDHIIASALPAAAAFEVEPRAALLVNDAVTVDDGVPVNEAVPVNDAVGAESEKVPS